MSLSTYQQLLRKIKMEMERGVREAQRVVSRQIIVTHWAVGESLVDALPGVEAREFCARMIQRLSKDLDRPQAFFYTAMQFYRSYPKLPHDPFLSWSHYTHLMRVGDMRERRSLTRKTIAEKISHKDLQLLIAEQRRRQRLPQLDVPATSAQGPVRLALQRGRLYHYKLLIEKSLPVAAQTIVIDLGFHIKRMLAAKSRAKLHSGLIVRTDKSGDLFEVLISRPHPERLYTYMALVERVVDGDTIILQIDCGFQTWVRYRVRLRGIDCPERHTMEGRRVWEFVKAQLKPLTVVIIKTYQTDKYGRYLGDVFYLPQSHDAVLIARTGIFLNQQLLDEGMAVPAGYS